MVLVGVLLLVEWGTQAGWISALTLPKPSDVALTLLELAESGLLWKHLEVSLVRLCVGAALGIGFGVAVGVLIGLFSMVRAGLLPLVAAIFPIPKI
ncbi:MAG: ABC transporter permease, partial [Burkholderiaceae bacterium]